MIEITEQNIIVSPVNLSVFTNAVNRAVNVTTSQGGTINVTKQENNIITSSGATGPAGPPGAGVPTGGVTGQILAKASNTDYDTEWVEDGGGVESVVAGLNISVDNTDPLNPVVNSLSDRYKTTSNTSHTIVSSGTLTFTVGANLSYTPQQEVVIAFNSANHMHGTVVSYSGTALVVDIKHKQGSGTYATWTINLDGTPVDALTGTGTIGEMAVFTGAQVLSSQAIPVTTPAGADRQIQFNDGGAFGASSEFTYVENVGAGTADLFIGGNTFAYAGLKLFDPANGDYGRISLTDGEYIFNDTSGSLGFIRSLGVSTNYIIGVAASAVATPLYIQGAAGQTADLLQARNNIGTLLASISAAGGLTAATVVSPFVATGTERYVVSAFANFGRQFGLYVEASGNEGGFKADSQFTLKAAGAVQMSTGGTFTSVLSAFGGSNIRSGTQHLFLGQDAFHRTYTSGALIVGATATSGDSNVRLEVRGSTASAVTALIKGAAAQTANLQEWQNSAGTVLSGVNHLGNIGIGAAPNTAYRLFISDTRAVTTSLVGNRTSFTPAITYNTVSGRDLKGFELISAPTGTVSASSLTYTGIDAQMSDLLTIGTARVTSVFASGINAYYTSQSNIVSGSTVEASGIKATVVNGLSFSAPAGATYKQTGIYVLLSGNAGTTGTTSKEGIYVFVQGTSNVAYGINLAGINGSTVNYGIYMTETLTTLKHLLARDSQKTYFGSGEDVAMYYTGTNWVFDPEQTTNAIVFNESGANTDFRVEGDTDQNLLFLDAGLDRIGIGNNAPASKLHVTGDVEASGSANGLILTSPNSTRWRVTVDNSGVLTAATV